MSARNLFVALVENGRASVWAIHEDQYDRTETKIHAFGGHVLDKCGTYEAASKSADRYDAISESALARDLLRSVLANEARLGMAKTEPAPKLQLVK